MRRHYNYNSPVYQRISARIVEAFASHYVLRTAISGAGLHPLRLQQRRPLGNAVERCIKRKPTGSSAIFHDLKKGKGQLSENASAEAAWESCCICAPRRPFIF
ncbi:MAG: hypothetical protein LUF81_06335 [Clostridiales bacterium]|nr:hypothetical protein [Clostridiales bacterium]